MVRIQSATVADASEWLELRCALWPDGSRGEHRQEIDEFFAGEAAEPQAVLLAVQESGRAVGLAELSVRPCAEGCRTRNVAYLEGWFVDACARRQGVGRALLAAAEEWARARGCHEFASDTQPNNLVSVAAHRALGFEEVGFIRCFRKDLGAAA